MRLVYSPYYDLALSGFRWLHAFDGGKYGRSWRKLQTSFPEIVDRLTDAPVSPVTNDQLCLVHTRAYLDSLRRSVTIANAVELPLLRFLPNRLLQNLLLAPMRWATAGTLLAALLALKHRVAFQIGGGFHHAFRDHGEGFCIYSDVGFSILSLRESGVLGPEDEVLHIDLDAHRGNGIQAIFEGDPLVHHFDIYNFQIYPGPHPGSVQDFPFLIRVPSGTGDRHYLRLLHDALPAFLDRYKTARLAFYNAGTDVVNGDPLGRLELTTDGVLGRDRFVIESLVRLGIPLAIVTSGGYTNRSHELIAGTAAYLIETMGGTSAGECH